MLITSRKPGWEELARRSRSRCSSRKSPSRFCERRAGGRRPAAYQVADALGDLPLALAQAGASFRWRRRC